MLTTGKGRGGGGGGVRTGRRHIRGSAIISGVFFYLKVEGMNFLACGVRSKGVLRIPYYDEWYRT